ncbi:MAG: hypothetical protein ACKVP7_06590 [Hyphomicrobiaceae bacterium]
MGSLLARASQLVNLSLFGSAIGLFVWASGAGDAFIARAEPPGTVLTESKPPVPLRPDIAPPLVSPGAGAPRQALDPKGDAVVPPLQRKRPPPGQTSIPIVAPPEKKTSAAKPQPARTAVTPPVAKPAKAKPAPAGTKAGLGVKPDPAAKCATGLRYDAKQLKCVKVAPVAAVKTAPAPAKPAAAKSVAAPVNTKAVAPATR